MELTSGYPFWLIKDGLPFQYKKITENTRSSAIIIGGGISGALSAFYLTEAGVDCVLVDGRTIGLGSTCASTSLLQYELDQPLHVLKKKIGNYRAVKAYQLCGESIDKLCGIMKKIGYTEFETRPSLFFSTHSSEIPFIKKELQARQDAGFEVDFLTTGELKKEYGLLASSAILSQKGITLNAYGLTHALLQYSIRKGLKVFDRTQITSINYKRKEVKLKTSDGFYLQCNNVINCSGYEIRDFIGKNIVDFFCTYAVVSENQQEKDALWKDRVMFWNTDDPYLYLRLTKDNRIIIGGRDEPFNVKNLQSLYPKKAIQLQSDLKKILPEIPFNPEFAWSGTFGKTKDSLPYIGQYAKTPNTYYGLGFGGNGITFSLIAAEIISDQIGGRKNPDADLFSFER